MNWTSTALACVTLVDGTARCWGKSRLESSAGQATGALGTGSQEQIVLRPERVLGLSGATAVVCAGDYWSELICARLATGTMKCWGAFEGESLGQGMEWAPCVVARPTARNEFGSEVVTLSGSQPALGAILADGSGYSMRAGRACGAQYWPEVSPVRPPTSIARLADPWAVATDGSLWHGYSYSTCDSLQLVDGISGAVAVAASSRHQCVLKNDGTLWCWGQNDSGQLGDGTTYEADTPVRVAGLEGVVSVTAVGDGTCALLADGTVWCWGNDGWGLFGDGTTESSLVPVPVGPW